MCPIDQIDWNETPDTATVPYDAYVASIREAAFVYSRNGKYMASVVFSIDGPPMYKGTIITNNFVVGTDDDLQANQPDTWKRRGARELKQMLIAVFGDVASLSGHPETDLAATVGYPVGCIIDDETDNNQMDGDGQPNPYYGTVRNRFRKFFAVNDATAPQPGSLAGQKAAPTAARVAPGRPAARPPVRPPVAPPIAPPVAAPIVTAPAPAPAPPARTVPMRAAPPPLAGRPAPPPPPRAS